jgi:hypothetical protein
LRGIFNGDIVLAGGIEWDFKIIGQTDARSAIKVQAVVEWPLRWWCIQGDRVARRASKREGCWEGDRTKKCQEFFQKWSRFRDFDCGSE